MQQLIITQHPKDQVSKADTAADHIYKHQINKV